MLPMLVQGTHTTLPLPKSSAHSLSTQSSPRPQLTPHNKEKSQLCKKFIEFGICPYGQKCKFAHGQHELRKDKQQNYKYKTKECNGFVVDGYCSYGNRCNFIHPTPKTTQDTKIADPVMMGIKRG